MSTPNPQQIQRPQLLVLEGGDEGGEAATAPVAVPDVIRQRRARKHLAPYVVGAVLAAGAALGGNALLNGSPSKDSVPSLPQVLDGANGLNRTTPNLDEAQLQMWPDQETVTATFKQAADGASAIAAAIDPEVFSGPESNDKTKAALEKDIEDQTESGDISAGDSFSVPDIHPKQANVITGNNPDIPAS